MAVKLLALAVSVFVFAFIAVFSPIFEIKNVVINDSENCLTNFEEFTKGQILGSNLVFFNVQKIKESIKYEYACVEKLAIDRKFPSEIFINVEAKNSIAKIAETEFELTNDGLVVKASSKTQIPTIFLPADLKITLNDKIEDNSVTFALKIIEGLLKSDFTSATIRITGERDIAVYSTSDQIVLFSPEKNAKEQVDTLQQVLAKAKIDAAKIGKIDLRFEKVIISNK